MWVLGTSIALANPSFNGVWKLDHTTSDGVGHILEAQGLTWIERTIAERGTPTHVVTWTPERATVEIRSGWYTRLDELPLDGRAHTAQVARVGEVKLTSSMQGEALVTRAELVLRDGRPAVLETTRRLVDHDTMQLTMVFVGPEGPPLTSGRVFRRQADE